MKPSDKIKQRRDILTDLFNKSTVGKTFGQTLSYDNNGIAVFHMPYNPAFDHGMNQIHGGVYATLLDNAGWFTLAPHYSTWIATIEFHTRLLEPAEKTGLIARGKVIKLGKRIATAEMEVRNEEGILVGIGSGSFSITNIPFG